jgi:hypothetical protein
VQPDQDQGYLEEHRRWAGLRGEPGLPEGIAGTRVVCRHAGVTQALQDVEVFVGSAGYHPELPEEGQILPPSPSRATASSGGSSTASSPPPADTGRPWQSGHPGRPPLRGTPQVRAGSAPK